MTDTLLSPLERAQERAGVIGDRQLVCAQTFYLSRLTSHPVVIVPGTFVAVTGRGPKGDSNGSGKTSFLAAVSLLLADPEWRLAGGAKAPTALLFNAQATGGMTTGGEHYESAGHGYVVGVFAHADDPPGSTITVWCRIDTASPHLTVRWIDGVHLVDAPTDADAHAAADARWATLPRNDVGFNTYADALYGESPRCLAYVQQRGDKRNPPSLLQMHAGEFSPSQIGESLIRLTGQRHLLDAELEHRKQLAAAEETLSAKEHEDRELLFAEGAQLAEVNARDAARRYWRDAQDAWRLHFARGYVDVVNADAQLAERLERAGAAVTERDLELRAARAALGGLADVRALRDAAKTAAEQLADARDAHDTARDALREQRKEIVELTDQRNAARDRAAGGRGVSVDEAQATHRDACERLDAATERAVLAREAARVAQQTLEAVERGGSGLGGAAVDALRAAGIEAHGLFDGVTVADDMRGVWEPALAVWSDAVVVDDDAMGRALDAVATMAGAVLVGGVVDDTDLPAGIVQAPAGSAPFLRAVADRNAGEDSGVVDRDLRVHVVGNFPEPTLGRDARLFAARRAHEAAEHQRDAADAVCERLDAEARVGAVELERAYAGVELAQIEERLARAHTALQPLIEAVAGREHDYDAAEQGHIDAQVALTHHETLMANATDAVARAEANVASASTEARELETERARLALDYWREGWGDALDAAWAVLVDEPRSEPSLRKAASEALRSALWELGMKDDESPAPTAELAAVVRRRRGLDDDGEPGVPPASIDDVGAPLADYLDSWADQDRLTASTIAADRERRSRGLAAARDARDEIHAGLAHMQDAVETMVESSLESISAELDRLRRAEGGHGADLLIEAMRPEGATGVWEWRVTPRWRRVPGGPLLHYNTRANTAQEKLFTMQLVLAALLAAPNPRGRLLILDELGDSLGDEHRKAVLRAIGETAARTGITVLGTCQDSVLADAARACGAVLFFEHTADTEVLNRPTRVFGHDDNLGRIELTADAATWRRPAL